MATLLLSSRFDFFLLTSQVKTNASPDDGLAHDSSTVISSHDLMIGFPHAVRSLALPAAVVKAQLCRQTHHRHKPHVLEYLGPLANTMFAEHSTKLA